MSPATDVMMSPATDVMMSLATDVMMSLATVLLEIEWGAALAPEPFAKQFVRSPRDVNSLA